MNPLFLLFGLIGTGALTQIGLGKSGKDVSGGIGNNTPPVTDDGTNRDEQTTEEDPRSEQTPPPEPEPEPTPEPQPEPEPAPPVVDDTTPEAPDQTGTPGDGEDTTVIAQGTVDVMTGRTTTLEPVGDDIVSLQITSGVEHGNVTVNPDNTIALVLTQTDFIGSESFTYEATHSDGSTSLHQISLNVTPGAQDAGWTTGEQHYMLETDADDRVIVEAGDNHIKVYVSGSESALSLADIAAIEGMSVGEVTGSWLASQGSYGQSEDMALAEDAARALWNSATPNGSETSNWLLFERGYEYSDATTGGLFGISGESELNPVYVGAWGEGDLPEFTTEFKIMAFSENIVIQDIHFSAGLRTYQADNLILDHLEISQNSVVTMEGEGITLRNSYVHDNVVEGASYTQGYYANFVDGLLVENNFFDHNGWSDTVDPNMFSHNIYLGENNSDVTLRDTITMRAAATGAQVRTGGFVEDNVFLDNNVAVNLLGGDYDGAGPVGSYVLFADNLVTSGGHKITSNSGAVTRGVLDDAQLTTLVDNIVAHMADPNNPEEIAEKTVINTGYSVENPYYDDTIIWNWESVVPFDNADYTNQNSDGLDKDVLNQTTIQNFAAQLLGKSDATIEDLANYLRAQADGAFDDVVDSDLIIRFFQEGFGIAPDIRTEATTLDFVPNDIGDGIRWDNRLNWDTDDLPGLYAGDSVDLRGNDVVFGTNTTIDTLGFGEGGSLNVYGGKLTATGGLTGDGGHLNVEGAGQAWVGGSDGADIDITVQGGRFANTGDMSNADLTVTGGQTILATGGAEFDLGASKTLAVFDAAAKVGFDGDDGGLAILDMHEGATLAFEADNGDLGTIEEFRSGAYGDAPDVQSGIDLGDATLSINLAGLTATDGEAFMLMDADEIVGLFSDASVEGLNGQDARIVIDYENDSVTLELSAGNGAVSIDTVGVEADVTSGEEALWDALTAGQGVASDTELAMLPEEEDPLLDVAA